MGQNSISQIPVKSDHGYSPKYAEHIFNVICFSLCRHGLDHKLRQFRNPCRRNLWFVAICESNNTEIVFWVLGRLPRFTFDMNMKGCIFAHFGVISLVYMFMCMFISYKAHNRCTQETFLKGSDVDVNMFSALRSIPSVTMKSIWEVVFWNVTNCDSHKLRQFRNPCRRNLWFVAICDQGRDGTNWVK